MRRCLDVGSSAAIVSILAVTAAAQAPTYKAERLAGTDRPNLHGLWQALTEANWDI